MNYREYSQLYHHGIKGMHWGIRRYQNPDGTLTEAGKKRSLSERVDKAVGDLLGTENEAMNKTTKSSGKLRKTYYEMQRSGIKYRNGKYQYTDKSNAEKYKAQRALESKARRATKEYFEKYGDRPISYAQSVNAQKGAIAGMAVAAVLPIVGVWGTVPLGYYIGSKWNTK